MFDYKRLGAILHTGSWILAEIETLFVQRETNSNLVHLEGVITYLNNNILFKNEFIEIGVSKEDIEAENLPLNTFETFYFGRLDLVSIKELKTESHQL